MRLIVLKGTVQLYLVHPQCATTTSLVPEYFYHSRQENCARVVAPHSPNSCQPPVCVLSVCIYLFWNCTVWLAACVFFHLLFSRFIHVIVCITTSVLSWLSGDPLCGYTVIFLFLHWWIFELFPPKIWVFVWILVSVLWRICLRNGVDRSKLFLSRWLISHFQ